MILLRKSCGFKSLIYCTTVHFIEAMLQHQISFTSGLGVATGSEGWQHALSPAPSLTRTEHASGYRPQPGPVTDEN